MSGQDKGRKLLRERSTSCAPILTTQLLEKRIACRLNAQRLQGKGSGAEDTGRHQYHRPLPARMLCAWLAGPPLQLCCPACLQHLNDVVRHGAREVDIGVAHHLQQVHACWGHGTWSSGCGGGEMVHSWEGAAYTHKAPTHTSSPSAQPPCSTRVPALGRCTHPPCPAPTRCR